MRQWAVHATPDNLSNVLTQAITGLGEAGFEQTLLDSLYPVLPAASCSVYRTGALCEPTKFMSASHGIPDTTTACWQAYLSGPYRDDCTLHTHRLAAVPPADTHFSHITAQEIPAEHRAKVYEAHGMVERISIVEPQGAGALFAINFYRHQHQQPFSDAQIAAFEQLAPALLALTHKHLALQRRPLREPQRPSLPEAHRSRTFEAQVQQIQHLHRKLTQRECEVCAGILQGLTMDGIACLLGLSLPTVKTYRNRAFGKLGLNFRNELFAWILRST
jgi:DNA-binding CsgD family transcriptional regulator